MSHWQRQNLSLRGVWRSAAQCQVLSRQLFVARSRDNGDGGGDGDGERRAASDGFAAAEMDDDLTVFDPD